METFILYFLIINIKGDKEMKKSLIVLGTIAVVLLMVSTVTAVPQAHSTPMMEIVNEMEQKKTLNNGKIVAFSDKIVNKLAKVEPGGIITWLINLITSLIEFIRNIINFISSIIQLAELIITLINLITTLYEAIMQFIEWIQGILNPESFGIFE